MSTNSKISNDSNDDIVDIDITNFNTIQSEIYKSILEILIKWNNYAIHHSDYKKKINELIKVISNKPSNIIDSIFEKLLVLLFPDDILCTPGCNYTLDFFSDCECYEECKKIIEIIKLNSIFFIIIIYRFKYS